MADTQRTISTILGLLADNTTQQISPQDLRDAFTSWRMGHGQIYITAANRGTVSVDNTSDYKEATNPTWTATTGLHWFAETSNGRLYYTGTVPVVCHIACTVSFTCASNNQVIHMRIGKNTSTDEASEIQRKVGTGTDVGSTAMHLVTTMSNGDYISVWVRNATSTAVVTMECANLQVVTMPA